MAFRTQKISQMTPKGANLEGSDLLEVSTLESGSYVTRSITGQEIIDAAASGGGVTDVTASAPLSSTGGTTPDISMDGASALNDGFLKATDWTTFNNKQDALTLTTTGTSGAATLVGATLNIPQYSGGGGGGGIHALLKPVSGRRISYGLGSSQSGAFYNQSRLVLVPFFPANTFTISEILMNCNILGVGALCRLLIYSDLNGFPNLKLFESSDLDLSTTGFKIATTTFTFNAGETYWLGFHGGAIQANVTQYNQSVVYPIANTGASVNPANGYNINVVLGSAPTTITTANFNTTAPQWIGLTPA